MTKQKGLYFVDKTKYIKRRINYGEMERASHNLFGRKKLSHIAQMKIDNLRSVGEE